MKNKKVLIACIADPSGNPRPRRAIELCCSLGMSVAVLGLPCQQNMPFSLTAFFELIPPSFSIFAKIIRRVWGICTIFCPFERGKIFFEKIRFGLSNVRKEIFQKNFDLIIVENIQLLPVIFEIRGSAKILFDAREFYTREFEGNWWFDRFEKPRRVQLCKNYMPRCDAVVTVSEGLRDAFASDFGIKASVYRSTPDYVNLTPQPTNTDYIRMIYHGAAHRDRQIEKLIEIAECLDSRYSLTLMLVGNHSYQKELQQLASKTNRVIFRPPVPFEEIIPAIHQYDIGFLYYSSTAFNVYHCLPNKFFEYIQARLMLAIGPSPDMAQLIRQYGCGVVAEEFTVKSMAMALNALTAEDIDQGKQNAHQAAKELCFEKEKEHLIKVMVEIFSNSI